jgi:hypothetical protein
MIEHVKEDIFEVKKLDIHGIIHQANCHCTMGSGIAKFIREKFPAAYEADCKTKKGDLTKLGKTSIALLDATRPANLRVIFNLYGQGDFGTDKRYTSYDALETGFTGIRNWVRKWNCNYPDFIHRLAVPFRLGCNRAGGDWRIVRAILESVFEEDKNITLLICENPALEPIQNKVSR